MFHGLMNNPVQCYSKTLENIMYNANNLYINVHNYQ